MLEGLGVLNSAPHLPDEDAESSKTIMLTGAFLRVVLGWCSGSSTLVLASPRASWLEPWSKWAWSASALFCFSPLGPWACYPTVFLCKEWALTVPLCERQCCVMNAGLTWGKRACLGGTLTGLWGRDRAWECCGFMILNWNDLWEDILESQIFILHQHSSSVTHLPFLSCQF